MKTSLIICTYNWKEALALVLRSVARQSQLPDEVLVADDGSRPDTGEVVQQWAKELPVPVRHLWQEDDGFRVSRARNLAIAAAQGDYIILVDGDMVLHRNFIEDHKRAARPGYFIQGVRLITNGATGKKMLAEGIMDLGFFSTGIERRRHAIRNRVLSWLIYRQVRSDQSAIRSCNQAFWRTELIKVNGFNERMTSYGREDNELVARLYNSGIRRRNLKFAGLAIHLYHPRRSYLAENPNTALLVEAQQKKLVWCEFGVDGHLKHPASESGQRSAPSC